MNNIMLGKKEFIPILVVLLCIVGYFIAERVFTPSNYNNKINNNYSLNTIIKDLDNALSSDSNNMTNGALVENFQGSESPMTERRLAELSKKNRELFTFIKEMTNQEKEYFRNEIDIGNYIIRKKFNLEQVLQTANIENGVRNYKENEKFNKFILLRSRYLSEIVQNLNQSISKIDELPTNNFYSNLKVILNSLLNIYKEKLSYYEVGKTNYLDMTQIRNTLEQSLERVEQRDSNMPTVSVTTNINFDIVEAINKNRSSSEKLFEEESQNIEDNINKSIFFVQSSTDIDKGIKSLLEEFLSFRLQILSKFVTRELTFNLIDTITEFLVIGKFSDNVKSEKTNALTESNQVIVELVDIINDNLNNVDNILSFFESSKKGSIMTVNNEFKYFNTVDKNTNTLINFCRKMKKIDRPNNKSLLLKRFTKEFVKKKNEQINKLDKKIDQMLGEMTVSDAFNHNLYMLRTSEDAQKQINVIKEAKKNIDSIGKFKLNIK